MLSVKKCEQETYLEQQLRLLLVSDQRRIPTKAGGTIAVGGSPEDLSQQKAEAQDVVLALNVIFRFHLAQVYSGRVEKVLFSGRYVLVCHLRYGCAGWYLVATPRQRSQLR